MWFTFYVFDESRRHSQNILRVELVVFVDDHPQHLKQITELLVGLDQP